MKTFKKKLFSNLGRVFNFVLVLCEIYAFFCVLSWFVFPMYLIFVKGVAPLPVLLPLFVGLFHIVYNIGQDLM